MAMSTCGAKPAVLRCSRCGRFVDWEEARLQVICRCKPHLELPPVLVREATDADRPAVLSLIERDFGRTRLITFGEELHLETMPTVVAELERDIAGALIYMERQGTLHIVALATDPSWQRSGVGGYLVAEAELIARGNHLSRVLVATTNDNLPSLYFYQRKGYRITQVMPGAMAGAQADGPRTGFGGIPICDEIHLVKSIA